MQILLTHSYRRIERHIGRDNEANITSDMEGLRYVLATTDLIFWSTLKVVMLLDGKGGGGHEGEKTAASLYVGVCEALRSMIGSRNQLAHLWLLRRAVIKKTIDTLLG
jgi:hypothetical protein